MVSDADGDDSSDSAEKALRFEIGKELCAVRCRKKMYSGFRGLPLAQKSGVIALPRRAFQKCISYSRVLMLI